MIVTVVAVAVLVLIRVAPVTSLVFVPGVAVLDHTYSERSIGPSFTIRCDQNASPRVVTLWYIIANVADGLSKWNLMASIWTECDNPMMKYRYQR